MRLIPRIRDRDPDPDGRPDRSMSIIEHLEELRHRIVVSLYAIAVGAVVGWFLYQPALNALQRPFCDFVHSLPANKRPPTGCQFAFFGAIEPAVLKLKVVVFIGLVVALPVVLYEFWRFVVPGMTPRERRFAIPFVASSILLFAAGGAMAYVTLPKALQFLLGFGGRSLVPILDASRFIGFVLLVIAAFGLSFEFPLALIFLSWVGVLSSEKLRRSRRFAILFISIFAAVITPSQDPYTMLGMMIPMVIFYEIAILVVRFGMRK